VQLGIQFCETEKQVMDNITRYVTNVSSLLS